LSLQAPHKLEKRCIKEALMLGKNMSHTLSLLSKGLKDIKKINQKEKTDLYSTYLKPFNSK